jgi:protease-4
MSMTRGKKIALVLLILFAGFAVVIGVSIYNLFHPAAVTVKMESILVLDVFGDLPEVTAAEPPAFLGGGSHQASMKIIRDALEKARADDHIKSALLKISGVSASFGKLKELHDDIVDFKTSGKPVLAYLDFPTNKEYYLASAADKIYMQPDIYLFLNGLRVERTYYRTILERVGITVEVASRGKYKSFPESFTRDSSSVADREQLNALLDGIDQDFVKTIASSRGISETRLRTIINDSAWVWPEVAIKEKLIDSTLYFGDLKKKLAKDFGKKSNDETFLVSGSRYAENFGTTGEKMAFIVVQGDIQGGKSSSSPFGGGNAAGGETISAAIEKAADDESIKAIVLRVDSPGGSGFATYQIDKAVVAAKTKKPVVVSMSGVAASGGYGVSMNADKIIAEPTTITGSIGVLSLKPAIKGLYDKLDIHREVFKRGKFSDALNAYSKMTPAEYAKFDESVARFYEDFITKVASGRKTSVAKIDSIAQGRVWTGEQAKAIGLVDDLGGLKKAVSVAKSLAKLDSSATVQLVEMPAHRSFYDSIFNNDDDDADESFFAKLFSKPQHDADAKLLSLMSSGGLLGAEVQDVMKNLWLLNLMTSREPAAVMPFTLDVK